MSARWSVARPSAAFAAALSIILVVGTPTARAQGPVYRNSFADAQAAGAGWSAQRLFSPRAGVSMLGRFHNDQAVLSLSRLAPHAGVVVAFDLHVIGAWTGERASAPTTFTVNLDDAVLLNSSLATDDGDAHNPRRQSFPDEPGAAAHPAALGAYRLNTLGVRENGKTQPDAVYRLVFALPHSGDALRLTLSAANLPGELADASWAVDNAVVYTVNQTADLDRARAAARDAVTQLAMGLPGGVVLAPHTDAPAVERLPDTFVQPAPAPFTSFGAFEVARSAPKRDDLQSSILPPAAAQGRVPVPDAIDTQLAVAAGRGMPAFGAAGASATAVPAIAARIEQPVLRRVSTQVYQSRFGQGVGTEWDAPSHGVGPRGERFAGPYGNKAVSLALDQLPPHDQLIIEADLYTIGDWPGDGPKPSKFSVSLDGRPLMSESFATEDGGLKRTQSYPASPSGGGRRRLPGADASAIDSLGYLPIGDVKNGAAGDATYRLRFVVPHDGSTGTLQFSASGLPSGGASWGVDNVTVVASGNKSMRFADATGEEPDDNADDGTYNNPFVRAPGPEWSVQGLEKSPSGETFLGPLQNETASLTVKNFPQHTHLVIAADMVVLGDWQGNTTEPSQFSITLGDGTQVFATTFASDGGESNATQNYPDVGPARNLPGAGAFAVGSLGYNDPGSKSPRDATYRLLFTVPHGAPKETINFTVKGLRGDKEKAGWGLDNVVVGSFDGAGGGGGGGTALGDAGALASGGSAGGGFGNGGATASSNPYIPSTPSEPFPHVPDGGGGGGGGTPPGPENHTTPTTPAPGTIPALVVGLSIAARRRRP